MWLRLKVQSGVMVTALSLLPWLQGQEIIVMLRACMMSVLFYTGTFHFCPTQLCLLFSPPSVFPLQPSDIIHYFLTVFVRCSPESVLIVLFK